jgi:hypothetical protein
VSQARGGPAIVAAGENRPHTVDGSALFYGLSGAFIALFAFVLWYCPRHL